MTISKYGKVILTTDGSSFLKIANVCYVRKGKFIFRELSSEDDSLLIEWGALKGEWFSYSDRCNIRHGNMLYKIKNFSIYTPIYMTKTRIETEQDIVDVVPVLGCLAFFWMWFEEVRKNALRS